MHQSGSVLKLSTHANTNKQTNNGVMIIGTKVYQYTVSWRQHSTCFRGQPWHKAFNDHKKTRNASGSRLSGCQATLNARLLTTECGQMLHITIPLPTAHLGTC